MKTETMQKLECAFMALASQPDIRSDITIAKCLEAGNALKDERSTFAKPPTVESLNAAALDNALARLDYLCGEFNRGHSTEWKLGNGYYDTVTNLLQVNRELQTLFTPVVRAMRK